MSSEVNGFPGLKDSYDLFHVHFDPLYSLQQSSKSIPLASKRS